MNRRDFVELSVRLIAGLAIPGVVEGSSREERASSDGAALLGEEYLVLGLTAMARAKGWFAAHWGAAVLAGYYLSRESDLGSQTKLAVKAQLDTLIGRRVEQFRPLPSEPASGELIERIPAALRPALEGGLRAHGHAPIFAALAIRALRDAPRMAQPTLVERLCDLSRQIARKPPQAPREPEKPYADSRAMVEASFDELARWHVVLGRPEIRRPNFTHRTTHTEALWTLERLGYAELAREGHAGHRAHLEAGPPDAPAGEVAPGDGAVLDTVRSSEFWRSATNTDRWRRPWHEKDNRNGDWIASGHLFKVLYSYHRLLPQIADQRKVERCSRVLFERYLHPEVEGG